MTKEQKKAYKHSYYLKNKEHTAARSKAYREKNKEKLKIARQVYVEANREIIAEKAKKKAKTLDQIVLYASYGWKASLKYKYGLTGEQYYAMAEAQNHVCKICKEPAETKLFVDHDHKTGKVRGLLCQFCNFGLGSFLDNPELLENAKQYLYHSYSLVSGAS